MNKLKTIFRLLLFTTIISSTANAQYLPDLTMDKDFKSQVKSIDEFIQRFNGVESHPNVKDSTESRTYTLVTLFDYKMDHKRMSDSIFEQQIWQFVQTVEYKKVQIKLTDAAMYAVTNVTAKILGKEASFKIILQSQTYNKDRVRWAIVGVKGLSDAGIIDTKKYFGISPVEHETHFMGIGDIFEHNNIEIMGYRGKQTTIDELSVFFTMSMLGKVHLVRINELAMFCLEVPGYSFTINEQGRSGSNSGWLISDLTEVSDKSEYIDKLLGK